MDPIHVNYGEKFSFYFGSSYSMPLSIPELQTPPHEITSVTLTYKNNSDTESNFIFKVQKKHDEYFLDVELVNNEDKNSLCNLDIFYVIFGNAKQPIHSYKILHVTENTPLESLMPVTLASDSTIVDWIYEHGSPLILHLIMCEPACVAVSSFEKTVVESPTESEIEFDCAKNCNLLKDISFFYGTDSMSDLIISTNDKKFNAHKCILAARSTVFKNLLKDPLKNNESGRDCLALDAESNVVEEMLRYIYTGEVGKLDEIVTELYEIGIKYNLQDLQETCVSYMSKNISIHNAMSVLIFARRYDVEILLESLVHFFAMHADEILADAATTETLKPFFDIELSLNNFNM